MIMAVIFLNICFSISRSLHILMKDLQDFPKIPIEADGAVNNLVLPYCEEESRMSCRYLSRFSLR